MEHSSSRFSRLFAADENYRLSSWLFIRLLAVIYFIAFLSLSAQITGLVGPNGILPFENVLHHTREANGTFAAWFNLPNIFWLSAENWLLQLSSWLGCIFATMLFFGLHERLSLAIMFVLYLSLYHAGQIFTNFQWDTLLLEAGFLAIFLVTGPTRLVIWLYYWLLFRLRFLSGLSKIASGDPSWSGFTTLNHYFETQPLPHAGAWFAHQLPEVLLKFGVGLVFFVELIVPFFIFLPRVFRRIAAFSTIFLQLIIIATSNHNFVNLLTIVLCMLLLDDRIVGKLLPAKLADRHAKRAHAAGSVRWKLILAASAVTIVIASIGSAWTAFSSTPAPGILRTVSDMTTRYGLAHAYHIFPTMQVTRQELQIEGSNDSKHWKAYGFRYKPGALDTPPRFVVPHQPRLDWMIWFAPRQDRLSLFWVSRLTEQLKNGSPEVLELFAINPFPEQPPRFIRITAFEYTFTTPEEREQTGNWWNRRYLGIYPYIEPRVP